MNGAARSTRRRTWWTVPNLVTAIRLALIAPICALLLWGAQPLGAAMLAAVFGASDWMDGFLARKLDQVSRVGEWLDPLADRVGIGCIVIAVALAGAVPWWMIAVFPVVDVTVAVTYLAQGRGRRLSVTWIGKIRTTVTMAGVFLVMVGMAPEFTDVLPVGRAALATGALLHIGAGVGYLRRLLR